jgi:phosphatidylglycerophosphatase A
MVISPAQLRKRGLPLWKQILVSGLFTGLSPIASGTVASAVAALLYFTTWGHGFWVLIGCSLAAFIAGIPLARDAEKVIGHDPSFVTLDEFAGQWLAMASPIVLYEPYWALLTFFVFRVFDIAKLWPASYFDRRTGGLGIMADDMVAGAYANIVCHLIWFALMFVLSFI